jgi:hypothetical protein
MKGTQPGRCQDFKFPAIDGTDGEMGSTFWLAVLEPEYSVARCDLTDDQ